MRIVTMKAVEVCSHELGVVINVNSQSWVTIAGAPILVEPDPLARVIVGCPNINIGIVPCTLTLQVTGGYSGLVRIDGRPVCLDTVTGPTNGTPGTFSFKVRFPGQSFVECAA
jgi:hypothetical protein